MKPFCFSLSGIYESEGYAWEQAGKIWDLRELRGTDGYLDPETEQFLEAELGRKKETKELPRIRLLDSGNYHHMSKSPAVFDINKLKWMNGEYMKAMDDEKFYEMALPYIQKTVHRPLDFKKIAAMVKTRIEVFPDIADLIDFFEEVPEYDASMYTHKKMKTNEETSLALLQEVKPLLAAQEDFSNDALFEMLSAFGKEKGYKTGYIMWPIRTALSGKQMTPAGATEILEVLGKEESLARINKAIEKLSK